MAKRRNKEFDEASLSGILAHEIAAAIDLDGKEQSGRRERNLNYLRGDMPDLKPRPNGSRVTSRDLNDTVAWILPSIMRQFTASDRMAVYEAVEPMKPEDALRRQQARELIKQIEETGNQAPIDLRQYADQPSDDEVAEQATDYANFVFWRDNDGYRILYDATYDALAVSGDGIVKHWWDETPVTESDNLTGMSAMQIAQLQEDEEVEIVSQERGEPQIVETMNDAGMPVTETIETFNVKIVRTKRNGSLLIDTVSPEDFLIDADATTLEDYRFCAHRDASKTRSDLIEMGFSREVVDKLPGDSVYLRSAEEDARKGLSTTPLGARQKSMERIDLFECYLKVDVDGDGIAETVRAYYAGRGNSGTVLEWEVWEDDLPFSKIPCYPRAHEFISENVADRTVDIQQLRTVFWRAINDNLVASGMPQREVEEGSVLNPDALTNPRFGGLIWKKRGSAPIVPHEVPFAADKMFPAMDLLDRIIERRTGVSKTMMALDPEALQNQTATASQNARDASYSQVELIARNMAEGWRRVFRCILKLLVKHQDRPRVIRLRDKYVEMDPRAWNAGMDCSINVGLGTGSRDRDMAMLNVIAQAQERFAIQLANAGFRAKAVGMLPKITETMHDLTESAGIRSPERYWPEFKPGEIEKMMQDASQPQPDPKVQIEQARLQADMQKSAAEMQMDEAKTAQQLELERTKGEQQIILEREKTAAEMSLKRDQMVGEFALKREQLAAELQLKRELAHEEMAIKREAGFYKADTMAAAKTSGVHMGGEPG